MVLALNLLVLLVCVGLAFAWWKTRKHWLLGVLITFLIIYPKVQPSYMPKGDIQRTEVPGFNPSKAEIQDNNRKPVSSEIRNERQKEEYRNGLDFLK
jgi:hypothetical protein